MQSFLLISNDSTEQKKYLETFHKEQEISIFDRTILDEEGSLGIAHIRELQKKLFLAPNQSKAKSIIVHHANTLTIEAQNALLKMLEEPPSFVFIFLLTPKADVLLPTILSRCQIIMLERNPTEQQTLSEEKEQELQILTNGTLGQKLVLAEKISSEKQNASQWIEQAIRYFREKMLTAEEKKPYVFLLETLQEVYHHIQTTNVNNRLLLEHMLLTL